MTESLKGRIFTIEKPTGTLPVILEKSHYKLFDKFGIKNSLSRIENERIQRRMLRSIDIDPLLNQISLEPDELDCTELNLGSARSTFDDHKLLICQRCHILKNGAFTNSPETLIPKQSALILSHKDQLFLDEILTKKVLLVMLVDLVDFPYSYLRNIYSIMNSEIRHPILLVGNKIDLFPGQGQSTINKIQEYLSNFTKDLNLAGVHLISAKTGFGLQELQRKIFDYVRCNKSHVILLGRTNVGKSMLFKSFCTSDDVINPTISSVHGTTVGVLKKKISNAMKSCSFGKPEQFMRDLWLCDFPGILPDIPDLINSHFGKEEIEKAVLKTKIKPLRHVLKKGESGLLGGFLKIDWLSENKNFEVDEKEELTLQFFTKNSLPYIRRHSSFFENDLKLLHNDSNNIAYPLEPALEFTVDSSTKSHIVSNDVVIGGDIGWISVGALRSSSAKIRISTPRGMGVMLRTPPLRSTLL
jgi:ribosome biogenesis GTPase A